MEFQHSPPSQHRLRHMQAAAAALLLACAWPQAQAQVNRCSDANGNITYTDASCPSHLDSVEIEAAKTPEQIAIDQERAAQVREAQAQQRLIRLEEQRISAETAAFEASARASAATEAAARVQSTNYAATTACRDAMRQLERNQNTSGRYTSDEQLRLQRAQDAADRACMSPQDYAALQRDRASRPNTTVIINPPYWRPPHIDTPWQTPPPGLPPIQPPPINMPPKPPVLRPPVIKPPASQPPVAIKPPVLTLQKPPAQGSVLQKPSQEPFSR